MAFNPARRYQRWTVMLSKIDQCCRNLLTFSSGSFFLTVLLFLTRITLDIDFNTTIPFLYFLEALTFERSHWKLEDQLEVSRLVPFMCQCIRLNIAEFCYILLMALLLSIHKLWILYFLCTLNFSIALSTFSCLTMF